MTTMRRLSVPAARGELVAFAKGTLHDGGVPGFAGELNKIYVLRQYHRQGIGRRLVAHVARRFLDQGVGSMLLFGDARSPSNGFYERLGAERLLSVTLAVFEVRGSVVSPLSTVIGNCRPLAAWIVMILTAFTSVSGSTASGW